MTEPEVKNGSVAAEVSADCRVQVPSEWRGEFVEVTRRGTGRPEVFMGLEEGVRVEGVFDPEYYKDDSTIEEREERSIEFSGTVVEYELKPESAGGPAIRVVIDGDDEKVYRLSSHTADDGWSRPRVGDCEASDEADKLRVGTWRSRGGLMQLSVVRTTQLCR